MAGKRIYWLAGPGRAVAQVEGAEARDAQARDGWTERDEPSGNTLVWAQNEAHGGWATFPARILHVWQARGWQPGVPPAEVLDPHAALLAPVNPTPAEAASSDQPLPTDTDQPEGK